MLSVEKERGQPANVSPNVSHVSFFTSSSHSLVKRSNSQFMDENTEPLRSEI